MFKTHRVIDAKMHGLLRLREFGLFGKIIDVLSLFNRNILISPLEGEKKFLSELCEFRNFREGYNLKLSRWNSNSGRLLYFFRNINYNSDMLHHYKNNKGRLGILAQHKIGLKRIEPLSRISNAHYHSQRTAPSPRWVEGIDSVISNNFSDTNHSQLTTHHSLISETVFSRFTSHFSLKRTAFTLAEVLITLAIIGVVAAMTISVLITNCQKMTTITQLKKVYSTLSQAFELAQAENGSSIYWIQNRSNYFCDYFLPYLDVADYCLFPECTTKGIHIGMESNKFEVPLLKQIKSFPVDSQGYIVILHDGTMLYIYQSLYQKYWTLNIWVDLNGNKGPNRTGRDIFQLFLFSGAKAYWEENIATVYEKPGIYFSGGFLKERDKIKYENGSSNCSSLGFTCGALIQYDGWKIEKDYPW